MKRIISFVVMLCSAFMISAAVPVAAAETGDTGYNDVSASDWYSESVRYVTEKGLFGGTGEGTFSPETGMTRGMFVTVLGRSAERMRFTIPDTPAGFDDVDSGAYYSRYIAWAANNGIVNGLGDNLFGPDNEVTREQMCKIFAEFFEGFLKMTLPENNPRVDFADSDLISDWAADYVAKAQMAGIVVGLDEDGQTVFQPQSSVTRAAAATMFMRADKLKDDLVASEGTKPSSGNNSGNNSGSSSGGNSGSSSGNSGSSSGNNQSGGNSSSSGGSSGGGSGGSSGGSSSGGGSGGNSGNKDADNDVKTAVSYMRSLIEGYENSSVLVSTLSEPVRECLEMLIDTANDALKHYDNGGELNSEYVNEHYSSQIAQFRSMYGSMTKAEQNELQSAALRWSSYSQLMFIYNFFK